MENRVVTMLSLGHKTVANSISMIWNEIYGAFPAYCCRVYPLLIAGEWNDK